MKNFDNVGLTSAEAEQLAHRGLANDTDIKITKTNFQIVSDNLFTLFNLFNVLIGVALFCVGAYLNMFFLLIIALNCGIGIFQELRAKRLVSKLSLLSQSTSSVVRDGHLQSIPSSKIVLGDALYLEAGSQIVADATVVTGEIEVNEAHISGESEPIVKRSGDTLLSGSFVVCGDCIALVERVGRESFAAKLTAEAKKHKKFNSELLRSMRKVTNFTAFFIVPIGIAMFLEAFLLRAEGASSAVISSAAALLGMLPKGLVLLISIALAAGVIALSKKKILVQELHSLEALARTDVLCLDKTGTLTEGRMSVTGFTETEQAFSRPTREVLAEFLSAFNHNNNASLAAINAYVGDSKNLNEIVSKIEFSSERKFSAVTFKDLGTAVLGAPEILLGKVPQDILSAQKQGRRVLCFGLADTVDNNTVCGFKLAAVIELFDPLKADARQTLDYFRNEGIEVKIISGDSPVTVCALAAEAGFDASNNVDMSQFDGEISAVLGCSVFGRVTPEQKRELIAALKAQGHTVSMVGDGVNDVLALKEADCGIAMASGSDAAKQISQLVLLNSDFAALPHAVGEGRRVINNITRSAGVFFVKTIYSILLSILFIILNAPFPFAPIQITLIDLAIEAYPSLFMSFERCNKRIKHSFLYEAIKKALPFALAITISLPIFDAVATHLGFDSGQTLTAMYFMIGFISLLAVLRAFIPFNRLRHFLFETSFAGFYIAALLFHSVLGIDLPLVEFLPILLAAVGCCLALTACLIVLTNLVAKKFDKYFKNG